jgi:hypothetical protein
MVAEPPVEHSVQSSMVWGDEQVINRQYRAVILGRDIIAGRGAVLAGAVEHVKEDEAAVLSPCTTASSITPLTCYGATLQTVADQRPGPASQKEHARDVVYRIDRLLLFAQIDSCPGLRIVLVDLKQDVPFAFGSLGQHEH